MLKSLRIENFRCFKEYELQQLGRVNLLVGTNNCGKTSILEAIYLLYSQDDLSKIAEILYSRGEFIEEKHDIELEICHLFYGHKVNQGSKILIDSNSSSSSVKVQFKITTKKHEMTGWENLVFEINYTSPVREENGKKPYCFSLDVFHSNLFYKKLEEQININHNQSSMNTFLITTGFLSITKMIKIFESILLTSKEDLVIEALQIIEPTVKRIAVVDNRFFALLSDTDQRVPLGSMGDGIQRILGLTLALVNAKDGILLVDEIDTGLHFTALSKMWKLVWETAQKLNVQVFATTHNSDCWTSLTDLIDPDNPREDGILLHRIEKEKPHSILFTESEIAIAAERDIEVR
ncbi:MAG: ATP/GTP-binding protein [Microcystaceae cyanobacterium]